MEVYERINEILIKKSMTKRAFARNLIDLSPISNRTGEVISEGIVYSYLSASTAIKADLIPYISQVLNVPIEYLFYENKEFILNENNRVRKNIINLLNYAPDKLLVKIEESLLKLKKIQDEFWYVLLYEHFYLYIF